METALDLSFWSVMYWDTLKKKYIEKHNWELFETECRRLGITRIITKLTGAYYNATTKKEGVWIDQGLLVILEGLRQLDMKLAGGFHWYDPRVSHIEQLNTLYEKYHLANPHTIWIDIEQIANGVSPRDYAKKALSFLQSVEIKLNELPGIYSAKWFWDAFIDGRYIKNEIVRYPKWVAHYTTAPKPYMPKYGWPEWHMWQHTDRLKVGGLASLGTDANHVKPGVL